MTRQDHGLEAVQDHKPARPRDASASKEALFVAARTLFSQKGFERTTIREIGEHAGIDAALIARYFGSKADLYIAVIAADKMDEQGSSSERGAEVPFEDLEQIANFILRRSDEQGPGPILQALVRVDTSDEIRDAARARLARRLVEPVAAKVPAEMSDATLRSEIAISALLGISLARTLGWFDELQSVPRQQLVGLISEAMGTILDESPEPSSRVQAP